MRKCAFCDHEGKLSQEHIAAQWVRDLFPGPIRAFYGDKGKLSPEFKMNQVNFKAGVVCKPCNETWMSELEEKDAKLILSPLITGQFKGGLDQDAGGSIARYAFKTAVVLDHANRKNDPFFSQQLRNEFRETRFIPSFVRIWMCSFPSNRPKAHYRTVYHDSQTPLGYRFLTYVCTFALGNVAIQVAAIKQSGNAEFVSTVDLPKDLAVPIWPAIPRNLIWPHHRFLKGDSDFSLFATRWANIYVLGYG